MSIPETGEARACRPVRRATRGRFPHLPCALLLALPLLAAAPARAAAFADVNQQSLRYNLSGEGRQTVVLLHEMGMTLESWDPIMPALEAHYRVLRYDLRGFGLSQKIAGTVTFADEVADLKALLDTLRIDGPVALVGGAVGGAVALQFAAAYPERVRALVGLSPATGAANDAQRTLLLASADHVERTPMRDYLDASFDDIYPVALRRGHPERVAAFRGQQLSTDRASMAATLRMIAGTDFAPVLKSVQCPSLIVAAALYAQRPLDSVRAVADALPRGRFAVLQTGHFIATESPELLTPLLLDFLAAPQGR
ncbi:MAG: alpha/beta fold hydrolase [Solimonas sp.]